MRRWRGHRVIPADWGPSVVTIGVFDGIHRGHQQIIGHAVKAAADRGLRSVLLTFDPHPAAVLQPGACPAVLTEPAAKADLIEECGVDGLCVIPFTPEFAAVSAGDFVRDVLVDSFRAALVIVGENFRFGRGAEGDVALLTRLGQVHGFAVEGAALLAHGGDVVSSTRIRALITDGEVAAAGAALGRPHRVEGVVVRGDGRGRTLGYPTANLGTASAVALPADGVYACWATVGPERFAAAVSVGTNPTFSGQQRRVEAFLLDVEADLYGERVALEFVARLRPMWAYSDIGALVRQIAIDVEQTRQTLGASLERVSPGSADAG